MLIWISLADGEHHTDTPNDSSALSSVSAWPVRAQKSRRTKLPSVIWLLYCKVEASFPLKLIAHCIVRAKSLNCHLLPWWLLTNTLSSCGVFPVRHSAELRQLGTVFLVGREPRCRTNTICLVFYEMNQRLGDQWAPAVNANNSTGSLSGACCQSVASGACTFPGYTIGLWN